MDMALWQLGVAGSWTYNIVDSLSTTVTQEPNRRSVSYGQRNCVREGISNGRPIVLMPRSITISRYKCPCARRIMDFFVSAWPVNVYCPQPFVSGLRVSDDQRFQFWS